MFTIQINYHKHQRFSMNILLILKPNWWGRTKSTKRDRSRTIILGYLYPKESLQELMFHIHEPWHLFMVKADDRKQRSCMQLKLGSWAAWRVWSAPACGRIQSRDAQMRVRPLVVPRSLSAAILRSHGLLSEVNLLGVRCQPAGGQSHTFNSTEEW